MKTKAERNARNAERRAEGWNPYDAEWHSAHYQRNKERRAAQNREWIRRNPDKWAAITQKWKEAHPEHRNVTEAERRAAKRGAGGGGVSVEQWAAICEEYGHRCAYCAEMLPATMDHVEPLSKDGQHDVANVVPACQTCNSSKNDRTLVVWLARRAA